MYALVGRSPRPVAPLRRAVAEGGFLAPGPASAPFGGGRGASRGRGSPVSQRTGAGVRRAGRVPGRPYPLGRPSSRGPRPSLPSRGSDAHVERGCADPRGPRTRLGRLVPFRPVGGAFGPLGPAGTGRGPGGLLGRGHAPMRGGERRARAPTRKGARNGLGGIRRGGQPPRSGTVVGDAPYHVRDRALVQAEPELARAKIRQTSRR